MSNFWKGRRVLVTGLGGFFASHLVKSLASGGARVRAFVRYNSRNDPGNLALLPADIFKEVEVVTGDLRDLPSLQEAARGQAQIFHLGALITISYSYLHPAGVAISETPGQAHARRNT